jgi:hypothetical protein
MRIGTSDVLMVGSLPYDTVEEAFRAVATGLGRHAAGLPDGEVGDRTTWVGFLIGAVFVGHPQLEPDSPMPGELRQPSTDEERESFRQQGPLTFRVRPDERIRFDDIRYGSIAVESYRTLQRLREEGVAPPDVRFQVSLPAPNSAIIGFFSDPDPWPALFAAYADRLREEIALMTEVIPPSDLLVQFDLAWEVVDLSMGDRNYFPFWPESSFDEKWARHTERLGELASMVPADARLGFHWCYGTWGGWPMTAMEDLSLCVRLSNEAVSQAGRRVDYVHMPVVKHPGPEFFAPLADLDIGDTDVYLGIVHHTDGVEGFQERAALARSFLPSFGVSSVCGYGRIEPAELPHVLAVHRSCAEALQ